MPCRINHGLNKPCVVDGVSYPSRKIAAKALGIGECAVLNRLRSPLYPEYTAPHIAKRKYRRAKMFPCTINGTAYPSVEFASRHIGIGTDEIKRRLALIEYPGYVSAHIAKDKKQKPKRHIDCEYLVLGKTYKSLRDIAHNVGCAVSVALHRVNNPRKPDWRRMYRTQLDGAKPMTISMDAYRIMLGK